MVEINGVSLYLGGYIQETLRDIKDFNKHDWDNLMLITGPTGDGKTTLGKLLSFVLDPNITIKQWAYNADQFEKIVDDDNLPAMSAVVWDESDELTGHWASTMIQAMTRKMKRIRKKRLFIILITPTFHDMRPYFAVSRARCLFDVYAEPERDENGKFLPNRGRVRFFNQDKKRQLYFLGKKTWDMHCVAPNYYDSFGKVPDNYPINEAELEVKKDEAMKALLAVGGKSDTIPKYRLEVEDRLQAACWRKFGKIFSNKELGFVLGVSDTTIDRDIALLKAKMQDFPSEAPPVGGNSKIRLRELFEKESEEVGA